jgi:molybdate transport system ATP-binding protein
MIRGHQRLTRGAFALDARFEIPGTGVTGLFGPSGCGKTTLLRAICGLAPRATGDVHFADEVWQESARGIFVPPHERGVGLVFQHAALFPNMSVVENIRYAIKRRPAEAQHPTLDEVVELAGVAHLLDRNTPSLSGGERQRVAIARTLASTPRLLLLDEPVSALDLDSRSVLLPYLQRLCKSLSIPVLYVSHSASEMAGLADRVMMMEGGSVRDTLDGRNFAARILNKGG